MITIGSAYGPTATVKLSSRARELCSFLRTLPPGSSLPKTHIEPFRVVIEYLDGDDTLNLLTDRKLDTRLLLLFAQGWALSARLGLPALQNRLVSVMCDIYTTIIDDTHQKDEPHLPADKNILQAFRHLQDEVGHDSQAERFLVCFVARTTPIISVLVRQLRRNKFDDLTSENLLAEARSFGLDAIRRTPRVFRVSVSHPPRYKQLDVEYHPDWMTGSNRSISPGLQDLRMRGRLAQDRRRHRSYQASIVSSSEVSDFSAAATSVTPRQQRPPCLRGGGGDRDDASAINENHHNKDQAHGTGARSPLANSPNETGPGSQNGPDSDHSPPSGPTPRVPTVGGEQGFPPAPPQDGHQQRQVIGDDAPAPGSQTNALLDQLDEASRTNVSRPNAVPDVAPAPHGNAPAHTGQANEPTRGGLAPAPQGNDAEVPTPEVPATTRQPKTKKSKSFFSRLWTWSGHESDHETPAKEKSRRRKKSHSGRRYVAGAGAGILLASHGDPHGDPNPNNDNAIIILTPNPGSSDPDPRRRGGGGKPRTPLDPSAHDPDAFSLLWWRPKKGGRKRRFTLMSYRSRRYDE